MLQIRVTSNGETIGHLSCTEFRSFMGRPREFIPELVKQFNENKEKIGEPERVKTVLIRK